LDWTIRSANVEFQVDGLPGQFVNNEDYSRRKFGNSLPNRQVLYRSDTQQGLAVVSGRYKVVQPQQVMDFFDWYVERNGFSMSAAGTMRGGAILWATAQTGNNAALPDGDELAQYVLMSTSCDASSCTEVRLTNVRVVCANTLAEAKEEKASIKIRHSAMYDEDSVRRAFNMRHMGDIRLPFNAFVETAKDLAARQVNARKASDYLVAVVQRMRHGFMGGGLEAGQSMQDLPTGLERRKIEEAHAYKTMMRLFDGEGMGADQKGSRGTVWGLINAVTEYVDHHEKGRKQNPADRYFSAWMGHGHKLKQDALTLAQQV
jgi:phage/plasmid-like protein (TIGR03299 family)